MNSRFFLPVGEEVVVAVNPVGAGSCLFVMIGLPPDTWLRLFVWLAIGFVIYFTYGRKHSHLRKKNAATPAPTTK